MPDTPEWPERTFGSRWDEYKRKRVLTVPAVPEPGSPTMPDTLTEIPDDVLDTFIAGLDSPNHSPESRRAWCRLFLRDMSLAHIDALTAAVEALPGWRDDDDGLIDRAAVIAILRGEQP
jgi:hypothetical protein